MKIHSKYKDAHKNQNAIHLLPEIISFLASIASIDNHTYSEVERSAKLSHLADQAENLKFKMGYGY